jgi:hypothetical protein
MIKSMPAHHATGIPSAVVIGGAGMYLAAGAKCRSHPVASRRLLRQPVAQPIENKYVPVAQPDRASVS